MTEKKPGEQGSEYTVRPGEPGTGTEYVEKSNRPAQGETRDTAPAEEK